MRKTILLAIVLAFTFSGCAPKTTKRTWAIRVGSNNAIHKFQEKVPEMFYCFDRNKNYLEADFKVFWQECLKETVEHMPEMVGTTEAFAYGRELAACMLPLYFDNNMEFYSFRGLSRGKINKCEELMQEYEWYKN